MSVALDRARNAWGGSPPDWVEALARACDGASQARVAGRLGLSAATVNQALKGAYKGNVARIEAAVRGAYMAETVACPGRGCAIPTDECVGWRRRPYDGANHLHVRMYRACRSGCPHSDLGGGDAEQ